MEPIAILPKETYANQNGSPTGGRPHPQFTPEQIHECVTMVKIALTHEWGPNRERAHAAIDRIFDTAVESSVYVADLPVSPRIRECLERNGVTTVEKLRKTSDIQLLTFPQFGPKALSEVRAVCPLIQP